jgi:hypothetical protein
LELHFILSAPEPPFRSRGRVIRIAGGKRVAVRFLDLSTFDCGRLEKSLARRR